MTLLSPRSAAEALGVSVSTVMRMVRAGTLPASRVGGQVRIAPDDLAACARPYTHPSMSAPRKDAR